MKTAPKCHPGGSQIAPKSLQNGSRRPPEPTPRAETITGAFFAPFVRLLGGSWGAPGSLLAAPGAVFAPLGPLLAAPGALLEGVLASRGPPLGALWASFSGAFGKIRNSSKPLFFQWFLMVLASPGGPKSTQNGSQIALGRVLAPLGALLAPLGAVLASLGGLLALLGPLGRLLGRSWCDFKLQHKTWLSWNGKRVRSESCKHCKR